MSSQKRTACQAHLPNRQSKFPRRTMSRSDTESEVNASASQGPGLLARWKELFWDTFVAPFSFHRTGNDTLPIHCSANPRPSSSPPEKLTAELPLPPKQQRTRSNSHVPTNLLASSSSSSFSFRPLGSAPQSSPASTAVPSRLSISASTQTSALNSPPISAFVFEAPQLNLVAQTRSSIFDGGVRKRYRRRHIYEREHKERVKDTLERRLYELTRAKGYQSDFETFRGYCRYRRRLDEIQKGDLQHSRAGDRSRTSILPQDDVEFFQRAVEKATKSLLSPRPPKPFSPTIEQLNALQRAKDEQIRNRLHPKRKPVPERLPSDAQKEVNALLRKRGIISKAGREQVSDKDLARLLPGVWLNDEVINFYGQLIVDRAAEVEATKENKEGGKKKVLNAHYFSSFFWSKLQTGYEKGRLAKWTKKIDIFSKDIILMAINHGNAHWTSAAINFKQKRIESYDSMGYHRKDVIAALRSYLDDEHKNKKKKPFDFTGWVDHNMEGYPEQENGYDCGIFTCQTLEYLSRGEEDFNFTQKNMPYLRQKMVLEIGRAKLAD